MPIGLAQPGLLWQWWKYNTRMWLWGTDDLRVMSACAAGPIPPGVLVQVNPSDQRTVRVAQDLNNLVGVSAYDPHFHSPAVVYQKFDMLPVVRRGRVFALLHSLVVPGACAAASWDPVAGAFTADAGVGLTVPRIAFSVDTEQQYINGDGSPQADVPFPVQPIAGATATELGNSTCLLEVNL